MKAPRSFIMDELAIPDIALLAGGLATRLYPMTHDTPKLMLMIDDKPFIHYQLKRIKENGLKRVVLCVGKHGERIESYLKHAPDSGLDIALSFDGDKQLGTGGALKKALPLLSDPFFILYGDSFLNLDYLQIYKRFQENNDLALMTVFHNKDQWDVSNIVYKNDRIFTYDKKNRIADMNYIDYGLGLIHKRSFDYMPDEGPFDLAQLYLILVQRGEMMGYEVFDRFYEVGSFDGLEQTRQNILLNQ